MGTKGEINGTYDSHTAKISPWKRLWFRSNKHDKSPFSQPFTADKGPWIPFPH